MKTLEAGRKDDEIPGPLTGGGRNDHPVRAELSGPRHEPMCAAPRAGQIAELDAELGDKLRTAQVEHRQGRGIDAPQASPLPGRVDRAARRCLPLGPGGRRVERSVERPRLTRTVVAALGRGWPIGREGRRVQPGLPVDASAERGDRVQT